MTNAPTERDTRRPMTNPTARVVAYQQWLFNTARVYRLSEPIGWSDYCGLSGTASHVVVSVNPACPDHGKPEAMAFACDANGEFVPDGDRCSVGVAYSTDHDDAVRAMGYEVLPPAPDAKQPDPEPLMTEDERREFAESWNAHIRETVQRLDQMITALREPIN